MGRWRGLKPWGPCSDLPGHPAPSKVRRRGRSPGSRVIASDGLPGAIRDTSGSNVSGSPLTVAGAAPAWSEDPPDSLLALDRQPDLGNHDAAIRLWSRALVKT